MKKIKIIIERSNDLFTAYAENVEGVTGGGNSVAEAKKSIIECIDILQEMKISPKVLQNNYELVYKFDAQSFLNYYKGIFTNAALERITGINQKQIQHYATGLKKPRASQVQKIEKALHELGSELLSVEL